MKMNKKYSNQIFKSKSQTVREKKKPQPTQSLYEILTSFFTKKKLL